MKKIMMLVFVLLLPMLSFNVINVIAKTADDYPVTLENISEDCPHGRQLIFRDTDGDGEYDTVRKTNCDGTYTESPMSVVGDGSFDRPGAQGIVISGDIDSDNYVVKIFYPSDGVVLGYLDKETSNPVAVFTFNGY